LRILFAADDSPGAETARALVNSLRLPKGSTIRVVRSLGPVPSGESFPEAMRTEFIAAALESARTDIQAFAEPLRAGGAAVETEAISGRAGSVIVEEAERWHPDLIVVGSHGRGSVGATVLGSVGAEVIDHAPCPVLVARTTTVSKVVAAQDGSKDADAAQRRPGRPARGTRAGDARAGGPRRACGRRAKSGGPGRHSGGARGERR
jgi:nucleotide-binding universal stress UspA family protein